MEILAYIESPRVGARDVGYPVLSFDVRGDGWGALQVFDLRDPKGKGLEILSQVTEVRNLVGRPCVVEKEDGIVSFKKLLPAPAP